MVPAEKLQWTMYKWNASKQAKIHQPTEEVSRLNKAVKCYKTVLVGKKKR